MPQKICPRCGAEYATLKSATCPQCFAKLVEVDDETAAELAAARSAIERSPEYQDAKAAEDERFRHQSFQACLLAVALTIVTATMVFVMLFNELRHRGRAGVQQGVVASVVAPSPLPPAQVKDVMPEEIDSFHRVEMDQTGLSGTLTVIYHAAYQPAAKLVNMDVYAMDRNRPAAEQSRLRDVVQGAADRGGAPGTVVEVAGGGPFLYEVVGPGGSTGGSETQTFTKAWELAVAGH
jgi:hypothetical protein